MSDEINDPILAELRDAISIEPSPSFEARVRTAVAGREAKSSWLGGWKWSWAVATTATAAAALVLWVTAGHPGAPASPTQEATVAAVAAPSATNPVLSPPVQALRSGEPQTAKHAGSPGRARRVETVAVTSSRPELEVLVPPDQAIALQALLAGIREGRFAVPEETRVPVDEEGRMIMPAPLQIPAIKIEPLTPPPNGGGRRNQQ